MADNRLSVAVARAVEQDTDLAEEARALARKAIATANYYLDHGSPAVKLNVIKSIMPAIGRGMSDKGGEDAAVVELREQVAALMRVVVGESVAS